MKRRQNRRLLWRLTLLWLAFFWKFTTTPQPRSVSPFTTCKIHSIIGNGFENYWVQDSPPAWPQEAYRPRPPPPKVSKMFVQFFVQNFVQFFVQNFVHFLSQILVQIYFGRGYSWGGTPGDAPPVGGYPPQLGGYPQGCPPVGCVPQRRPPPSWGVPPGAPPSWGGTPGGAPQLRGTPGGAPSWGGTPPVGGPPLWTDKLKTLPSRHTPYAGGKNCVQCIPNFQHYTNMQKQHNTHVHMGWINIIYNEIHNVNVKPIVHKFRVSSGIPGQKNRKIGISSVKK